MKNDYFYVGLFLLMLSIGTCILSYRLGLGDMYNPGPGFLPFGVGALLGLMSAGLSLLSMFKVNRLPEEGEISEKTGWRNIGILLCGLLGYGIVLNFLGFNICNFLLMMLLLGVIARRKWWLSFVISLLTVLCAYLIFIVWLGVPFPRGPIGI